MTGTTQQVKVGLFVFIAFIFLTVMVFSVSDFYTVQGQNTYPLRVRFSSVSGIDTGAPVRVSGVKAGEVKSVRVYREEATQKMLVEVGILLSKEVTLEEDSTASITSLGFLGEKYLEIMPGTPGARLLNAGEILVGKESISMERLMDSSVRALDQIQKTFVSVNAIVSDEQNREALKGSLANSKEATAQFTQMMAQTNDLINKINRGEGTVGKLLMEDEIYNNLKELSSDVKAHPWKLFIKTKEPKKK